MKVGWKKSIMEPLVDLIEVLVEFFIGLFHQRIIAYSFKIDLKSFIMDPYWNILWKIVAYSTKIAFINHS